MDGLTKLYVLDISMILQRCIKLPAVLLSLLFLSVSSVSADDENLFDCRITVDGARFDLTSLTGEHTLNQTHDLPPTSMIDSLRFNLCGDLKRLDGVPEADQVRCFANGHFVHLT